MNSNDTRLMFIEAECVRWLKDVRYWLGYVVGRYARSVGIEDDASVNCDATGLLFEWRGRVVYIDGVKESNFEKALRRCPSYMFDFFHFGLDKVCALSDQSHADNKKYTDLVESLILDNFPGISQLNTWGMCDYAVSDLCGGLGEDICISVDGKMCCVHCFDVMSDQRANILNNASVYIFGSQSYGVYKIGYSKTPGKRISALATKLPFKIEMSHRISVDSRKAEGILHNHFASKRVNGEWFALSLTELEWLLSLKKDNVKYLSLF